MFEVSLVIHPHEIPPQLIPYFSKTEIEMVFAGLKIAE